MLFSEEVWVGMIGVFVVIFFIIFFIVVGLGCVYFVYGVGYLEGCGCGYLVGDGVYFGYEFVEFVLKVFLCGGVGGGVEFVGECVEFIGELVEVFFIVLLDVVVGIVFVVVGEWRCGEDGIFFVLDVCWLYGGY